MQIDYVVDPGLGSCSVEKTTRCNQEYMTYGTAERACVDKESGKKEIIIDKHCHLCLTDLLQE